MASAAKTTAVLFLIVGLLLAGAGSFLPVGQNESERGSVRDVEEFGLFTYTLRVTSGDTVVREDVRGWSDERVADNAGSTHLLASGVAVVAALLLALVGTILAATPRASRAGGVLSILGALGLATTIALAVLGMRARTEEFLGFANAVDAGAGMYLLAAAFLFVLLGGAVVASLRRVRESGTEGADPWEAYPAHVEAQNAARAQADAEARSLRCPDCGTTARVPPGVVPTCTSCGFHRRDDAVPAAPAASGPAFDAPDAAWA